MVYIYMVHVKTTFSESIVICIVAIRFLCETYYVPITLLVVSPSVSFELNIFASPKSEILGFISLSRRILLGLRSRCITSNRECLCR
jgi:hypothetical protein